VSNEKVSSYSRLSKWLDKKELKDMAAGLDKEYKNWEYRYKNGSKRCAIYVEKEDSFDVPHWILWKWCGWQFNRA
jgi:hypothetical protein